MSSFRQSSSAVTSLSNWSEMRSGRPEVSCVDIYRNETSGIEILTWEWAWNVSITERKPAWLVYQFSRSVVSDSLRPYGLQHIRPPCPSPAPRSCSNSSPSSWWCHPAIASSVVPFSSCPQSLPACLFQWVNSSHAVAKVLEFQLQHQSFKWTARTDLL